MITVFYKIFLLYKTLFAELQKTFFIRDKPNAMKYIILAGNLDDPPQSHLINKSRN